MLRNKRWKRVAGTWKWQSRCRLITENQQTQYLRPAAATSRPPAQSGMSSTITAVSPDTTSCCRTDDDNVRAPIPPVRQVLVDDFADMEVPMFGPRTRSQIPMFNNTFRDFQREARQSYTLTPRIIR